MKSTTTIVLLLVAAALGVFVFTVEKNQPGTRRLTEEPPLQFSAEDAAVITITRSGESIVLQKKEAGRWHLSRPVEDRADQAACARLLEELNHLVIREVIDSSEVESGKVDLSELGLTAEQGIALTVFGKTGPLAAMLAGKNGALENTSYVVFPENSHFPDIYIVEANLSEFGSRTIAAYRDPKVLPLEPAEIGRLLVRNGDSEVEFFLDPWLGLWKLGKPLQSRADQAAVDALIEKICALESVAVIENPDDPAAAAVFGQQSITAWRLDPQSANAPSPGEDPAVTFEIAVVPAAVPEEAPRTVGRVSGRDALLQLPKEAGEVFAANPNTFRDPHLAQIPEKAITGIIIQTRDNPDLIITNNGRRWMSLRDGAWEGASNGRVKQFLQALNRERIIDFVADTSANLKEFGLAPPAIRIGLTTSQKVTLPGIAPEPETPTANGETPDPLDDPDALNYVIAIGGVVPGEKNDVERLYAQFGNEPFVVSIDPAFANNIPIHPLKWKDTSVLAFNIISLREISISRAGESGETRLAYDFLVNDWRLTRDETDLTAELDPKKAQALAETLGSLAARDWVANRETAYRALENPALTIEIVLELLSDEGDEETQKKSVLTFAPAADTGGSDAAGASRLHYGRLDNSLDVFLIEDKTLQSILTPLTKEGP